MIYQVDCSVLLTGKQFWELSVWNMFCRKKTFTYLIAAAYALGLGMIAGGIPTLLSGNTNGFILNAGMGAIMLLIGGYMVFGQVSRLKRISKNEELMKKTAKHIRITQEQVTNYRVEAGEERKYEWGRILGVYRYKDYIVICSKKDEQLMVLDKTRLSGSELEFVTNIVDEKQLWRKPLSRNIVITIFAAITAVIVFWALGLVFRK